MRENRDTNQSLAVVDIFAGPGGLSEVFSAFETTDSRRPFKVKLSIEKDRFTHTTLLLRAFYRQFSKDEVPDDLYLEGDNYRGV